MTNHPGRDYRLVDVLFPCPERVNTMTSYEMEQDRSPDIIIENTASFIWIAQGAQSTLQITY